MSYRFFRLGGMIVVALLTSIWGKNVHKGFLHKLGSNRPCLPLNAYSALGLLFSERELTFAICCCPSICRLSVTLVHPTRTVVNVGNFFCVVLYLGHPLTAKSVAFGVHCVKVVEDIPKLSATQKCSPKLLVFSDISLTMIWCREPLHWGIKCKRDSKI